MESEVARAEAEREVVLVAMEVMEVAAAVTMAVDEVGK